MLSSNAPPPISTTDAVPLSNLLFLAHILAACEVFADGVSRLAVDPAIKCTSEQHLLLLGLLLPSLVLHAVGLPVWLVLQIRQGVVYSAGAQHERCVRCGDAWSRALACMLVCLALAPSLVSQSLSLALSLSHTRGPPPPLTTRSYFCRYLCRKEAEHASGVGVEWRVQQLWLLSSFRRARVYYYPLWLVAQGVIVAAFAWVRDYMYIQAAVWLGVALVWAALQILWPAYRCVPLFVSLCVIAACLCVCACVHLCVQQLGVCVMGACVEYMQFCAGMRGGMFRVRSTTAHVWACGCVHVTTADGVH